MNRGINFLFGSRREGLEGGLRRGGDRRVMVRGNPLGQCPETGEGS